MVFQQAIKQLLKGGPDSGTLVPLGLIPSLLPFSQSGSWCL